MAAMFCLELASQLEVRNINTVLPTMCDSIYIYTMYIHVYTVHISLCPCMYMYVCAYVAL